MRFCCCFCFFTPHPPSLQKTRFFTLEHYSKRRFVTLTRPSKNLPQYYRLPPPKKNKINNKKKKKK